LARAAASSVDSSEATSAFRDAASGRGNPAGGIMPARTLRITFSHTSACAATLVSSGASSARSPVFSRWL
jgi:hypothetical protein